LKYVFFIQFSPHNTRFQAGGGHLC
jgi:hypothetical protein